MYSNVCSQVYSSKMGSVGKPLAAQSAGDNVVISSRSEEAVKAVTNELRERHGSGRVTGVTCNVCKAHDVANLVERAQADLGSIDLWINNAGTNAYSFKSLIDSSASDLMEIVDTNVLGTMICCQAAIRVMRKQPRGGHIFNMAGAGADGTPTPRFAAYGATKRSLEQLGKSLQVREGLNQPELR
jgi:chlorophyll(ide) b reductase